MGPKTDFAWEVWPKALYDIVMRISRDFNRPVLEITNLPLGDLRVTVEGRLIESTTRLSNGTVLIDLPLTIERATTINVLVR